MPTPLPALKGIRLLLEWLGLLVLLCCLVSIVFYFFPLVFRMASNADSLVMLEFARDILIGQSLSHWNMPRAPYLFPDALIGMGVMGLGWSNQYSFTLIAVLHCLLLVLMSTIVLRTAKGLQQISVLQVGFLISLAILTVAIFFPVILFNLYWQLFASGAHFLMALVVMAALHLCARWRDTGQTKTAILVLVFLLCLAEGVSDSLAAFLLYIWIGSQLLWRFTQGLRPRADLVAVASGITLGTVLSFFIPRQSLLESFFSFDKFISAVLSFTEWLISSPANLIYMLVLLALICAYPFLIKGTWPKKMADGLDVLKSDIFLPCLGVMCATPIFFQEVGSIRYLAFPGLISLISLALIYLRLARRLRAKPAYLRVLVLGGIAITVIAVAGWQWNRGQLGPQMRDSGGKDMIGLAVGSRTDLALACLQQAKARLDLRDGVATYWNARPTRFASHFETYLAQINPWRPRSGYMMWGNNGIDLVYSDSAKKIPRHYNYVLATQHELSSRLWGSLPSQASQQIECPMHTIFYYESPDILWDYLFPLEVPFGFAADKRGAALGQRAIDGATRRFPADDFFTLVGKRADNAIMATGSSGVLAYGPYIPLLPGQYRLRAIGHLTAPAGSEAIMDVSHQFGKAILKSHAFTLVPANATRSPDHSAGVTTVIAELNFTIKQTTDDVEFRLQVPAHTQGLFTAFELQRAPAQ